MSPGNNVIGDQMGFMNDIKIKVRKTRDWRNNTAAECPLVYQNKVTYESFVPFSPAREGNSHRVISASYL